MDNATNSERLTNASEKMMKRAADLKVIDDNITSNWLADEAEKLKMRAADLKAEVEKTETSTKQKEEPLSELEDEDRAPPPEGMITLDGFVNFLIANYCPITKYLDCIKDKMHADLKSYLQTMDWQRFYTYTYSDVLNSLPSPGEERLANNLLRILVPIDPPVDESSDDPSPEKWRYETYHGANIIANIYEFATTRKFVKASAKP